MLKLTSSAYNQLIHAVESEMRSPDEKLYVRVAVGIG